MVDYTHSIIPNGFTLTKLHLKPILVQKFLSAFLVAVHVHMQYPGISHHVQVVHHTKYLRRHRPSLFRSYSTSKAARHPHDLASFHEDSNIEKSWQSSAHIPSLYMLPSSS